MSIGMDIAALNLKRHVDITALVTGDRDFVPAVKSARREGARLHLFTLHDGVKEHLISNADPVVAASATSLLGAAEGAAN